MENYPKIYTIQFAISDDESLKNKKFITAALLDAANKLARPQYDEEKGFFTNYDWRLRFELCPHSSENEPSYVLDVGQNYDFGTTDEFKQSCKSTGHILIVNYCDNVPAPGLGIISQKPGVIKIYAITSDDISESAKLRWAADLASTYVEIIESLHDHSIIVDTAALQL